MPTHNAMASKMQSRMTSCLVPAWLECNLLCVFVVKRNFPFGVLSLTAVSCPTMIIPSRAGLRQLRFYLNRLPEAKRALSCRSAPSSSSDRTAVSFGSANQDIPITVAQPGSISGIRRRPIRSRMVRKCRSDSQLIAYTALM